MTRKSLQRSKEEVPGADVPGTGLGKRVRVLRTARGESLTEAAAVLKVTKSYLSLLERNDSFNVGSDLVVRIARHYRCSTDYLLGVSSVEPASNSSSEEYFRRVANALAEATRDPVAKVALDRFVDRSTD